MLVNIALSESPTVLKIATIAMAIPAAIRPYSIAVAPRLLLRSFLIINIIDTPIWGCLEKVRLPRTFYVVTMGILPL